MRRLEPTSQDAAPSPSAAESRWVAGHHALLAGSCGAATSRISARHAARPVLNATRCSRAERAGNGSLFVGPKRAHTLNLVCVSLCLLRSPICACLIPYPFGGTRNFWFPFDAQQPHFVLLPLLHGPTITIHSVRLLGSRHYVPIQEKNYT
ncbi:hypothetical protein EJB05_45570, partial [Eragrostis curvula]